MTVPQQVGQTGRRRRPTTANGSVATGLPVHDPLMWAITFLVLIHVWRLHDPHAALRALQPGIATVALAGIVWLLDHDPRRRLGSLRSPVFTAYVVLVVTIFLSIPGSLFVSRSLRFMITDYSMTAALLILIAVSVRTVRDVEWIALSLVAGGALFGMERLTRFTGGGGARLGTGYYDPNDLALLMVCTLPLAIYFLRRAARGWQRALGAAALLILLGVFMRTISRGGFLGMIGVTLYILFQFRAIKTSTRVVAVTVAVVAVVALGSEDFWTRMSTLLRPSEDYNAQANVLSGRMSVWKRGVGYMAQNPVFGVGVQAFGIAEGQSPIAEQMYAMGRGFKWSVSHNSFIEIGAETGLIGLAAYLAMFVLSIRILNRIRKLDPPGSPLSTDGVLGQALIASLLGFMISGFFLSQGYYAFPHALFGTTLGLIKLHPAAFRRVDLRRARGSRRVSGPPALPLAPTPAP